MKSSLSGLVGHDRKWVMPCLFLALLIGLTEDLQAQTPSVGDELQQDQRQVVVLKTGSVYSGHLELEGGKYVVHRNNGASIRFSHGEVDFVTHSLEDAYHRLLERVSAFDVLGHQRLANWCIKYRQIEGARRQLETLKSLSGGEKTVKLLERQIEQLVNPPTEITADESGVPSAELASSEINGIRRLPRTGSQLASREELRATLDSYSRDSLREFNRSVHLRMVNGCAAARCHGDADNPMRLWRMENRSGITSTGAQRNLHALTRYIDRENPQQSVLLRYISEVHGGMETPAYDVDSHHYHAIRDWVLGVGLDRQLQIASATEEITQASFEDSGMESPMVDTVLQGELIPAPVDLNQPQSRFIPRDEFDPEIFNRKYGNAEQKPAALANHGLPANANSALPPATKKVRSLPPIDQ